MVAFLPSPIDGVLSPHEYITRHLTLVAHFTRRSIHPAAAALPLAAPVTPPLGASRSDIAASSFGDQGLDPSNGQPSPEEDGGNTESGSGLGHSSKFAIHDRELTGSHSHHEVTKRVIFQFMYSCIRFFYLVIVWFVFLQIHIILCQHMYMGRMMDELTFAHGGMK